ncbi:MarR family transcriptional regulator [Shewanella psychropiezotolerans]|uniref:MarR family transcriptional regulator n=1 Tax=Shewanella psychropiezotolerans TaxID=2593655 RepID=A0ABX5XA10_9GAMM|nr:MULTISPECIES: MarR family transcriptional regulator [Shewanella]MPY21498.1 MarR family transcriptional regulator [Shewanella sp. YLB-07]MPY22285.1 MarR family transcriptional regulator [Shewanella sp. YLB-07]QDO86758.1 MarR family transcriptional regulator [Shewanella psychropiezotolerans]
MNTNDTQASSCLSDNVCFALYTAGNALVRAYRPLLDECGLTYPQYLVMQALWLNDGVSLTHLSQATRLDLGTLTPIVKRLENKDLLIRAIDAEDERKKVIRTTHEGLSLKQEALALKQVLLDKVTLSEPEIESLRKMCMTLTQDLNRK